MTTDNASQFMVDFGRFVGNFETSQVEPGHGNHLAISIGGQRGSARICSEDGENIEIVMGWPFGSEQTWKSELPKIPVPTSKIRHFQTSLPCIDDFCRAIRRKTRDYPSFDDGIAVQRVLDALVKSMKTNRWEKT